MTELNGCEPKNVKILGPYTFSIGDTSSYGDYVRGGVATQVKMPQKVSFVSWSLVRGVTVLEYILSPPPSPSSVLQKKFSDSLADPEFVITDFAKFDHPEHLHLYWQAMDKYYSEKGSLPSSHLDLVTYVMDIKVSVCLC